MKSVRSYMDQELQEVDNIVYEYALPSEEKGDIIDTSVDTRTKEERVREQMDAIKSMSK